MYRPQSLWLLRMIDKNFGETSSWCNNGMLDANLSVSTKPANKHYHSSAMKDLGITIVMRQGQIRRPCRVWQSESSNHSAHLGHFPHVIAEGGSGP